MSAHADKTSENPKSANPQQHKIVATNVSQLQNESKTTYQFIDNRPEAIAQRKLQETIRNSPRTRQALQLQAMMQTHTLQTTPQIGMEEEEKKEEPLQGKFEAKQQPSETLVPPSENNTGLPDNLKTGIENLSGHAMDDVKVHYNSPAPAQLQAHAYAQGADIHLAPGQEKHLPHEAWHVVQQAQGRVQPTMQMKGGVNVNDDKGLEKEADVMGVKAIQFKSPQKNLIDLKTANQKTKDKSSSAPIQRVRGGMEYTEKTSTLYWRPGANGDESVAAQKQETISGNQISFFLVPNNQLDQLLGAKSADEHVLLRNGQVKLINDEPTPEWVIERHGADVDIETMVSNIQSDINILYVMRDKLAQEVESLQGDESTVVLGAGHQANLGTIPASGWFIYTPGESRGTVQITFQYQKQNSIENIAKVNVSKYLSGEKLQDGEELGLVKTGSSIKEDLRDIASSLPWPMGSNPSAWKNAGTLLQQLSAASVMIPYGNHDGLSTDTIGAIKLMVLNDALSTTMSRFDRDREDNDNIIGYAQEKNMQQFFPKSERQNYVHALQRANVPQDAMGELREQINGNADAIAALFWRMADPLALEHTETFNQLGIEDSQPLDATRREAAQGRQPSQQQFNALKNAILGENGALLSTWIKRAALAYTDVSGNASDHQFQQGYGSVIRSDQGYTPVSGNYGAVYERREAEIPMAPGSTAKVLHAIRELATSA